MFLISIEIATNQINPLYSYGWYHLFLLKDVAKLFIWYVYIWYISVVAPPRYQKLNMA